MVVIGLAKAKAKAIEIGIPMNVAILDTAYGMESSSDGLMGFAGGIPIKKDDQIIGYVGVSGGPIDQDFIVASAAAAID